MKNRDNKLRTDALRYHAEGRPGKIEIKPTKPHSTQYDLSLAYSPGVAEPCLEIERDPANAYRYTTKGNLVAVISNGTAVLGLGDIGPLAGKPVMEGKALLFKIFADIDVFDIELDAADPQDFIDTVKRLAPTFGGINLEDIKAPECFEIERRLREELDIPVMHDDQHGTAIISGAALLNALDLTGRDIDTTRVVVNGAGAAAISCARFYVSLGVRRENIVMCDSKGVIRTNRRGLTPDKAEFATTQSVNTLQEALIGADVFLGLSVADVLTQEMIRGMACDPIVFALANPKPEISYHQAMTSRPDVIFATGRSDYPNQVNNVLGFPYIFRGALDVRAHTINESMKVAAARALAGLAREAVPEAVLAAYMSDKIEFGRDYLIPKPLDPRLLPVVSEAVAQAAVDSGVATEPVTDWGEYRRRLARINPSEPTVMMLIRRIAESVPPRRVIIAAGDDPAVISAAASLARDKLGAPTLVGSPSVIEIKALTDGLDISLCGISDPQSGPEHSRLERYRPLAAQAGLPDPSLDRGAYALSSVLAGDSDVAALPDGPLRDVIVGCESPGAADRNSGCQCEITMVLGQRGPVFFVSSPQNGFPEPATVARAALTAVQSLTGIGLSPKTAFVDYSGLEPRGFDRISEEACSLFASLRPDDTVTCSISPEDAILISRKETTDNQMIGVFVFPSLAMARLSSRLMRTLEGSDILGPVLIGGDLPVIFTPPGADARTVRNAVVLEKVLSEGLRKQTL